MLAHLKTFWKVISTGWVVEYPERGQPPRDFFDRKDRRPIYSDSLPKYGDMWSYRRQCQTDEEDGSEEGDVDGRRDKAYPGRGQCVEEEVWEDAVLRWSDQIRLKVEKERK
ncbi:hypothetical protein ONS95_002085 [Cadophora gregata]|uniref:uncharacterized protein n=1 Tax=Cadophora gregata TaxID=51156 RepID=UPI0026DB8E76|nr:uncharacterized protein ONS95_002085 [Cadophora gregata]KAK0111748.1 hypothetical protein ONS95_002085 [Cadophora gregata]KAK0111779.1 hypothetical protein ONS96_001048 [Cadophora gregata f. sp. sojae]